jgi:hypothetical protein
VNSAQKTARTAGALYLLSSIAAGIPLIYVPTLIVTGNWERRRDRQQHPGFRDASARLHC